MIAFRRFLRLLFALKRNRVPREVRRRLRRHKKERDLRLLDYAAAWQANWDREAVKRDAEARDRRSTYTAVAK